MQFGIDKLTTEKICLAFKQNEKVAEVIIYGNRATRKPKFTAKIELAINGKNIELNDLLSLELKIASLKLDYKCTICILNLVSNLELKNHILTFGKVFYSRNAVLA